LSSTLELENSATRVNGRAPLRACRPATLRDWITAQSRVRLGRLDRYPAIRRSRDRIVKTLAHAGSSIEFDTEYGFKMFLPASYVGMIIMALDGVLFHPTLVDIAAKAIRPGDIVIDGGSNVGFFTLLAGRLLQGKGRVFAFEPDPDSFELLRKNVECNGLRGVTEMAELALTNSNGSFDFSVAVDEPMLSGLLARPDIPGRVIRVRGMRLDDYLKALGQRHVDVIKLDLEGAEPEALLGMREALRSARLLVFEVNEPQLKAVGVDSLTLIRQTAEAGSFDYVAFIDERNNRICPWDQEDFLRVLQDYKFVNVLCAKRSCFPDGLL